MPFDPRAWPGGSRLPLHRLPDCGEVSTASTTAVSAAEVEGEAWVSPASDVERVFSSVRERHLPQTGRFLHRRESRGFRVEEVL
jgi:hypothetical protein